MKRQSIRSLLLLLSFAAFPLTVVLLAPGPPLMSLRAGVVNLSVLVILAVIASGFFLRRAFCGWLCPGGGCQLAAEKLNDERMKRQRVSWPRVVLVVVWAGAMIGLAFFGDASPEVDVTHPGAGRFATSEIRFILPFIPVVVAIFVFVLLFGRRGFCQRGCWIYPLIALSTRLGMLLRVPSLRVTARNPEACRGCRLCTKNCSMSIDVLRCVRDDAPLPASCVQCGTCVDKCPKKVLSFAFGLPEKPARPQPAEVSRSLTVPTQ